MTTRILFAGAGEFGLPTLQALLGAGYEMVHVISQPDRPAGRGKKLTPAPVTQFCLNHDLPVIRTDDINALELPPADLLVVIAFGQKIGPRIIDECRLKAINLHASILPKYRGAAPINAAIIAGETVTGNSVIRLAEKMDAGAILGQSQIDIGATETAGELHDRLAADGAPLVLRIVDELTRAVAAEREQDHSQATLARRMSRESSRINWRLPARQIARQIRGMFPWPGCRVRLLYDAGTEAARATLVRATYDDSAADQPAGTVLADGTIGCDAGRVRLLELQPEGKRPMPLAAYRNGHRWEAGMYLESI